jgi:simple sugar transport system ATP-binding protein
VAGGLPIDSISTRELARLMVGPEFGEGQTPSNRPVAITDTKQRLVLGNISVQDERGLDALKHIHLEVGQSEILGVAGVAGNGQRELAQVVAGLRLPSEGRVHLDGADVTGAGARSMIHLGVAHIPEDRLGEGLVGNLPLADNAVLKSYDRPPLAWGPLLWPRRVARFTQSLLQRFSIRGARPESPTRLLSGGQLQRLLLAREMALDPRVIVAVHPTRGLDVAATQQVQQWLVTARNEGAAVLLISEDLDEVMQISDRIAVIYEGEIVGSMPAQGANREQIGLMMAGAKPVASGVT